MNINEKASYIKGLAEGMKFDTTTDTGRLIKEMIGLLEDMALSISDLEDENARLEAYIAAAMTTTKSLLTRNNQNRQKNQ